VTRNNGLKGFAAAAAFFLLLGWLRLGPAPTTEVGTGAGTGPLEELVAEGDTPLEGEVATEPGAAGPAGVAGTKASGAAAGTAKTGGAGAQAVTGGGQFQCARGKNGGATAPGVTATKIRLATTAVLDGPAKSLLEESPVAMKAVIDKVNKSGGICGRLLDLTVVNDSFKDATGLQYIKNFIAEGYFALPVVPSAEGLGAAIEAGEISKAKIPVVGTDGMRSEQYGDPYVWPVASATVTAMRVMAKYGYEKKEAKTFALVWDEKYKFGQDGKDAFVDQVTKMAGKDAMVIDVPLAPEDPSYTTKAQDFNKKCGTEARCDMIAMLLLPETAKKWLSATTTARANKYTAGAQTLFTDRFAQDCVLQYGDFCNGFAVWTGYNPPIGAFAALPGVAAYVNDVKAVKPGIDVTNQFVEGAYLGMSVFVEALKKVGPNLTREGLKAAMDSMTFNSDLASALTWKPGNHAANVRSQAFSMTVSQKTFRGWANEGTGFLLDPAHGG
jgi:ABC-type branched-subunit amino acid transport system substrate-binding protein